LLSSNEFEHRIATEEFPLKKTITHRRTIDKENDQQPEREQSRLLPPVVRMPSMSDHCGELAHIVLHTIAPEALPGQISTISDREIEELIEVSAIALCWHLAAMVDPNRRERFMQELPNETLGLAVGVEAAGIAVQKGIIWHEALQEIHDSIGLSQAEEPSNLNQQQAEDKTRGTGRRQTGGTSPIEGIPPLTVSACQTNTKQLPLPRLVAPPGTLKRCCERVVDVLGSIDAEATPGSIAQFRTRKLRSGPERVA
jgi:hypothetical protein